MAQDWRKKSIFEMIAEGHCEATHVQHYSKNANWAALLDGSATPYATAWSALTVYATASCRARAAISRRLR